MIAVEWPAASRVRAICTTREGGVSQAPYDSLNLGSHVGDDPAAVAANRQRLAQSLGVWPVFLDQVHGTGVAQLEASTPDGMHADGCVVTEPGIACTIMVADCVPILFADTQGRAVAAAHAGWRGLAAGIVERTHAALLAALSEAKWAAQRTSAGSLATEIVAWLGPCIGSQAFEVGEEVREEFLRSPGLHCVPSGLRRTEECFKPKGNGKWLADLAGLTRLRLEALGVDSIHGNDGTAAWCTFGNPGRFFSHRRDRVSGRMAACVWLATPHGAAAQG